MGIAHWDELTASDDLLLLSKLDTTRAVGATEAPPISGVFGWLPPELVEAVCAALLHAVRPNIWGAERAFLDFGAMVATCRGAKAAISRPLQIEVRCRRAPVLSTGSNLLRLQFPYTEMATRRIRARFELAILGRAIGFFCAAHCADPTRECCRGERDGFNRFRSEVKCAPGSLCAVALGGRVKARISVVASSGAQILCATDDGVILRDNARIWAVAPRPSEEFFPGQELATTTLVGAASASSTCTWAAAEGAHVAVCVLNAGDLDVYTVTVWADHGRRVLSVHRVSRLGGGADRADLHRMWMHNGEVWLACVSARLMPYNPSEWLRLVRLVPGDEVPRRIISTPVTNVRCMSVANQAGHMAFMQGHHSAKQGVHFFDQDDRRIARIGTVKHRQSGQDVPDMLALSPHGDVVIVMLRNQSGPCFVFYRRLCGFGWTEALMLFMAGAAQCIRFCKIHSTVFSPCGETMLVGLRHVESGVSAGVLAVNVARTMRREKLISQFTLLSSTHAPRQMVWSDGVWLETAEPGGVVRLGLM